MCNLKNGCVFGKDSHVQSLPLCKCMTRKPVLCGLHTNAVYIGLAWEHALIGNVPAAGPQAWCGSLHRSSDTRS